MINHLICQMRLQAGNTVLSCTELDLIDFSPSERIMIHVALDILNSMNR